MASASLPPSDAAPANEHSNLLIDRLQVLLDKRRETGMLRSIAPRFPTTAATATATSVSLVDFSSNDYLGLSQNTNLQAQLHSELAQIASTNTMEPSISCPPRSMLGSTGSRLLSGNSQQACDLECQLALHYCTPTSPTSPTSIAAVGTSTATATATAKTVPHKALLFNSGYDANLSLFSAIPQQHDLVLYDELIHASVHDGLRLRRFGKASSFAHNNVNDVRDKIKAFLGSHDGLNGNGCVIIAVEAVYSMDGDTAPLRELAQLAAEFYGRVHLIVDEAHSTGVIGERGAGLSSCLGVENAILARLHTFGKGMGAHGAVVIAPPTLIEFLVNYGRPLIYSTMMSFHSLTAIRLSHEFVAAHWRQLQSALQSKIALFRMLMRDLPAGSLLLESQTAIQGIVLKGNDAVIYLARQLISRGLHVLPIRFPTVPKGSERVRICLHVHNTEDEIRMLAHECLDVLRSMLDSHSGVFRPRL